MARAVAQLKRLGLWVCLWLRPREIKLNFASLHLVLHKTINFLVMTLCSNHPPNGFTLLELLVVMVIIGLLASYVGPRFFEQVGKSEVKTARAQIDAFGKALDTYRLDVGRYPNSEQGLRALAERPAGEVKWSGPYLQKAVPVDPWGQLYQYKAPGENGRDYDIISLGKDGQSGGEGDAADIHSWDTGR